jgi:transglutaminase-like putative cysteine protease
MFLRVEHRLWLEYDAFIRESFVELRLQPRTLAHQTVATFTLAVGPPTTVQRYRDWNDNVVHHLTISRFHERIEVRSRSLVSTHPAAPAVAGVDDAVAAGPADYRFYDWLHLDGPLALTPRLRAFARAVRPTRGRLGERVLACSAELRRRFAYRKNVTSYDSRPDDFLKAGGGVCQDFAHVMLVLLRLDGIPCRYVSGYLHVESPTEPAQSHAWIEFHSPRQGWIPFDATHDREIDERYVVVGYGRHYDDVPPNRGIYRGAAQETLRAEVRSEVVAAAPLVTPSDGVEAIDVPVYQDMPERRLERPLTRADIALIQQQQQQ